MVTSLHDGMNLVAKEYMSVAAEDRGMLILSRFTGAAHELRDALLVNPYDLEETAEAIRAAVEMPPEERRERMRRMAQLVREQNIYRWASLLLDDLAPVRPRRRGQAGERASGLTVAYRGAPGSPRRCSARLPERKALGQELASRLQRTPCSLATMIRACYNPDPGAQGSRAPLRRRGEGRRWVHLQKKPDATKTSGARSGY